MWHVKIMKKPIYFRVNYKALSLQMLSELSYISSYYKNRASFFLWFLWSWIRFSYFYHTFSVLLLLRCTVGITGSLYQLYQKLIIFWKKIINF